MKVSKKILSLNMFDVDKYDFKTQYGEMRCINYELKIDGYIIKIHNVFGKLPYGISLVYPSGYKGEAFGFRTAEDAINYLNREEWWNFKEPSKETVRRD